MISTINFLHFLEPLRKSLFSSFPGLGDPSSYVKALFNRVPIQVKADWVSKEVVNSKDGKPWEKRKKLIKRTLWQESRVARQTMRGIVILQQLSIDIKRPKHICEVKDNLLLIQGNVRTIFGWRRFRDIGLYTCDCHIFPKCVTSFTQQSPQAPGGPARTVDCVFEVMVCYALDSLSDGLSAYVRDTRKGRRRWEKLFLTR